MNKKHIHAELIKQWADGAEIQYNVPLHGDDWYDCKDVPQWGCATVQFRIKPEEKKPVVRWLWTYRDLPGFWRMTNAFLTEDEMDKKSNGDLFYKLEWSATEFPE